MSEVWSPGSGHSPGEREDLSKRFDPDELLALGLAYAPERYFGLVRTRDAILASARTARARAIETRSELRASRERSRAASALAQESFPNADPDEDATPEMVAGVLGSPVLIRFVARP